MSLDQRNREDDAAELRKVIRYLSKRIEPIALGKKKIGLLWKKYLLDERRIYGYARGAVPPGVLSDFRQWLITPPIIRATKKTPR